MLDQKNLDLSNYRMEKAKELCRSAERLFKDGDFGSSVNRSYYSIFNAIRSLLALFSVDSATHKGVINLFERYFIKSGYFDKKWSKIIHATFDIRQLSDYKDFFEPTDASTNEQLENAKDFISEVTQIRQKFINESVSSSSQGQQKA